MIGEIITIGNELTTGRILDLNSWYAAGRLTASGFQVVRVTSVGDDAAQVSAALTRIQAESRFVIVTGGLGSTDDDLTSEIVAAALNRPLHQDVRVLGKILEYVRARGLPMTRPLEKMTFLPEGARILHPELNTCGFCLVQDEVPFYFLPGVPDQMRHLFDRVVLPELFALLGQPPAWRQRTLKVFGLDEPSLAERLRPLEERWKDAVFGFYPEFPEIHLTLSLKGSHEQVDDRLDAIAEEVATLLGPYLFSMDHSTLEDAAGRVLLEKGMTLSVAESCTGGLIGHRLTNVAGSSRYFQGGVIAYDNRIKMVLLGVRAETLEKRGAVSPETAREMALGVRERMGTDLGISVTGIAGPEGGSEEKPVGTVHLGLSHKGTLLSKQYRFWGNRTMIKKNSAAMALDWIRRWLRGDPLLPGL